MQFNDLGKQWQTIREVVLEKIDKLGHEGSYINGKSVSEFEQQFAEYFNSKYAIGVSNGTDGLKLALQTYDLKSNDLVIIPANTFVADYLAVKNLPLDNPKIALIDQDEYFTIDVNSLESFLENVGGTLKKGGRVSLVGFGSWSISKRAARDGRNPQTGKTIKIAAKNVVKFKAGADLDGSVNK